MTVPGQPTTWYPAPIGAPVGAIRGAPANFGVHLLGGHHLMGSEASRNRGRLCRYFYRRVR
jgi:hypothetical protein